MNYLMGFGFLLGLVFITACNENRSSQELPVEKEWIPGERQWYKGNLHTHSYWSDGDEFPEVIMDWYKSNGYHFVALSDHNTLAEGDMWVEVPKDSIHQEGFEKYLAVYGADWVTYERNLEEIKVKLKTLDEYGGLFEDDGEFLIIQSEEITDRYEDKPVHINATNVQKEIKPRGGKSVADVMQNNIDQVIKQRRKTGIPMIPHINHPNFGYAITAEDLIALHDERFFEVYNGHHMVHNLGDSVHMSTEEMWDLINIAYLAKDQPLMYGLATDDSHHYHTKSSEWDNAGRGWIMVLANSLEPESLINSMENGQFYATTGVLLDSMKFLDNKILIDLKEEEGITYTISFIGYRKDQSETEVLMTVTGTKAEYELTEDILFVRGKITSSKLQDNPIENMKYEMAWTQPVLLE